MTALRKGEDVSNKTMAPALAVLAAVIWIAPALAADDAALNKELAGVISAQGFKCAKFVRVSTQAARDYLVTCDDGSSFQITADKDGKLVAQVLGGKILHPR
jgi:hypothetical protein